MSIADTISSMENNLSNAYDSVNAKGGTLPANKNLQNLSNSISSIPSGGAELPNIEDTKNSTLWYMVDEENPICEFAEQNYLGNHYFQGYYGELFYFDGTDKKQYKNGAWEDILTSIPDYVMGDPYEMLGDLYIPYEDENQDAGTLKSVRNSGETGFTTKTFASANMPTDSKDVWCIGNKYYYSHGETQWEYDIDNDEWITKIWGNVNDFYGKNIWSDGFEYYYSDGTVNYVLEGNNWVQKTWNFNVYGQYTWYDGKDVYNGTGNVVRKLEDGEWSSPYLVKYFNTQTGVVTNANFLTSSIIRFGNNIYAIVAWTETDDTDPNDPITTAYYKYITNKRPLSVNTGLKTSRVGEALGNDNEEAFTVGNINNALEILNNGNIGGGGVLISKTITENGVYNAIDDGASGYSSVDVQVSGGGGGAVLEGNTVNYEGTEQTLRNFAFFRYETLESVDMPDLTTAGEGCFQECYNLNQVSLPSLTQIPQSCFASCSSLTEYDFTGVETVGNSAFAGCDQLATFTNLGDVETIEPFAFGGNPNFTGTLSLANTINVSGFDNTQISALNIPSAETIGDNAFQSTQLQGTLNLQNIVSIGDNAFAYTQIDTLVLPSVESIGQGAFSGCDGITSINLPNLLSLGGNNFSGNLTSATIPSVQDLGENAFTGTGISTISIPDVINIGSGAFADCQSLASITMTSVQNIGYGAFMNTLLGGTLSLADCVSIEPEAFSGLGYTSVTLPSIVNIGSNAFVNNASLTTISVGGSETEPMTVGYGAFENCTSLTSFTFNTSQVPGVIEDAWQGTPIADDTITGSFGTIYIPNGSLADYTQVFNDFGLNQYVARLTEL